MPRPSHYPIKGCAALRGAGIRYTSWTRRARRQNQTYPFINYERRPFIIMTHIDFNAVGGFFPNASLVIPNSTLLDRGKISLLPPADLSVRNMTGWILIVPLDRTKIPPNVPSGPLPQNVVELADRLTTQVSEEVTISFGAQTMGDATRFAALRVNIGSDFSDERGYKGPSLVIKKLQ